ncbi:Hsp20 family protein [Flavobacterium sp.]|jgi:molecular chaperone IbpA|uniref:Hsp20 family protein n=1 Tax=Flavobacterium sp. TaxID=239 RepID=UPI0037BF6CD1
MTQFEIRTLDLPAVLNRQAIGFDRMFNELNRTFANARQDNYPPHNVIELDDTHFVIEVAVAGFKESELDVEFKDQKITIRGQKTSEADTSEIRYQHKGISTRNFERTFPLAEHLEVRGATVQNGILAIALELVVPEEKQAKKIPISFAK